MYKLSRLLLISSILAFVYTLAVTARMSWPTSGIILLILVVVFCKRNYKQLTTLGSARFANRRDLRAAGMLDADTGLIIGRLEEDGRGHLIRALCDLFHGGLSSAQACRQFFAALGRRQRGPLVRLSRAIHTAVFSPSGGGKGVSCVIPWLQNCRESACVVDFKGENASVSAEIRRKEFGHTIVRLDPFKVTTQTPDCFNPLSFIDKNSPNAIDDCNDLAKALVIRTGEEKDPHFCDAAEIFLAALIAVVVFHGVDSDGTRSLQTVRDILSNPQKLDLATKLLLESTEGGGMLGRLGGQLTNFVDKERASTQTTIARFTRFLDSPAVAASTRTSSFDPAELRNGKMTVYMILPPNHMRAQSPLLRVWIGSLLRAVVDGGLQERNKVHFILDEMASVGHLESIDDALDKFRAYGIRLQMYFQSMAQLRKCSPENQEQTLLSNTTQVFFGVNDQGLPGGAGSADYVSARLGEKTIIVKSGGHGQSEQWSGSGSHGGSGSRSRSSNDGWQQQARRLLKPEEVVALPARTAITFTPGVPPIATDLMRYYEEPRLAKPAGPLKRKWIAGKTFVMAVMLCALSVGTAIRITERAITEQAQRRTEETWMRQQAARKPSIPPLPARPRNSSHVARTQPPAVPVD